MKAADYRSTMTEAQLQQAVTGLLDHYRWRWYHTHDSRRSNAGFPDLIAVRGDRLLVAELKTEKGIVSPQQKKWMYAFEVAGVLAYVWRPIDLVTGHIVGVLR